MEIVAKSVWFTEELKPIRVQRKQEGGRDYVNEGVVFLIELTLSFKCHYHTLSQIS